MNNVKLLIAGIILVFAFKTEISSFIKNNVKPAIVVTVEIEKPDSEFLSFSSDYIVEITDKTDILELSVLNDEYSKHCLTYNAPSSMNTLDVYYQAMKELFVDKYKGKYPKYSAGIKSILIDAIGTKDKVLTEEELVRLSNLFKGLAWNLADKLNSK